MRVAASDLANIGSTLSAANAVAAAQTTAVQAAAADEVSTAIAALFGWHAQTYQSLSAQATSFHDQFVQTVASSGTSYWSAEATNVEQTLLNAINAPTEALFGRPLIGDGATGKPSTGWDRPAATGASCGATAATAATAPVPVWPAAPAVVPGSSAMAALAAPARMLM